MDKQNVTKEKGKFNFLKNYLTKKVTMILVIVLALGAGAIGLSKVVSSESKTTKIGFEDIGELATQTAYCTEINVTEASRELFGLQIPFTESKYIYSYDVIIKAGFNFEEIEWTENDTTIEVKLPMAQVLNSKVVPESFKLYHEDESIFRQITMTENNEALTNLEQTAIDNAVANGLLDNARSNAETILTGFFSNVYDLEEYEIIFTDK